jgi:hypothetical protein
MIYLDEDVAAVTETLELITSYDLQKLELVLADLRAIWDWEIIAIAAEHLPKNSKLFLLETIKNGDREIAEYLSKIIALSDEEFLAQLTEIRKNKCKAILVAATKLLSPPEVKRINKMVVLQNIANNKQPIEKVWEEKKVYEKPKRRAFSSKIIEKCLS